MVLAAPGTPERRAADAMRAHPEYVGGTGRDVTALMMGVPGLLAKDGAEGVYAVALDDGRAVALKVDDGGKRARQPVMVAALRRLGLTAPVLDELATMPILGGGKRVGAVQAVGV
jgi:L-asparaginase II